MTDYTDIASVVVTGESRNVVVPDKRYEIRDRTITDLDLAPGAVGRSALAANVAAAVNRGVDSARRDYPLGKVMASPPTVSAGHTFSGGSAPGVGQSTIANAKRYMPTETDAYRVYAGKATSNTNAAWVNPSWWGKWIDGSSLDPSFIVDFEVDCTEIELITSAETIGVWVWVDGELVSADPIVTPGTGQAFGFQLTFATRAPRRISVLTKRWWGVMIGPNDTIWRSSVPLGPRVIVMGDSYTEGTGAGTTAGTALVKGFAAKIGELMGWPDIWGSGAGATGYLNPGGAGRKTFRQRVQTDVIANSPSVVIVEGGINDQAYNPGSGLVTPAQIGDEAALLFAQIRAGLPNAVLVVLGPMQPSGSPTARLVQTRDAIFVAARANGALVVDNIGGPEPYSGTLGDYTDKGWMTGTGKVGTPTGTGNADLYTSSDAVHPSPAGHEYLARRIARALFAAGVKV